MGMLPRRNIKGGCTICRKLTNILMQRFLITSTSYYSLITQLQEKQELPVSENQNALSSTDRVIQS